jgi:beta-lactam-binding protein with PASTA domain
MLEFFKKHYILKHLLLLVIIVVLLFIGLIFWLDNYTRHDEQKLVPDVIGMTEENAATLILGRELNYDIVDSVFRTGAIPGAVVDQDPKAGSFVKKERKIYLIVNAKSAQMTALPDVVDLSLRQAGALLTGADFKIKEVVYKPSDYRDLVLEVIYNEEKVNAGDEIPTFSELVLHIGDGGIQEVKDSITSDSTTVEEEIIIEDDVVGGEDDLLEEDELLF